MQHLGGSPDSQALIDEYLEFMEPWMSQAVAELEATSATQPLLVAALLEQVDALPEDSLAAIRLHAAADRYRALLEAQAILQEARPQQ